MSSIADAIHLIFFVALGVVTVVKLKGFLVSIAFSIVFAVLYSVMTSLMGFSGMDNILGFMLGVAMCHIVKFIGRKTLGFY